MVLRIYTAYRFVDDSVTVTSRETKSCRVSINRYDVKLYSLVDVELYGASLKPNEPFRRIGASLAPTDELQS